MPGHTDAPALRAVIHPVSNAPWPTKAGDGAAHAAKEPLRVTAANVQERQDRDIKLRAGPAKGAADSARHPKHRGVFDQLFLWPLSNQGAYLDEVAKQSKEHQAELKLKRQEAKESLVSTTITSESASRSQLGDTPALPSGNITQCAATTTSQASSDAEQIEAMTQARAFDLFKQEYEPAVMEIWRSNKASVSRAGGTANLTKAVWARMNPHKRRRYLTSAAQWALEQHKRSRPQFRQAMQQTAPTPLPEGRSFSLESSQNWHSKMAASHDPVGAPKHAKSPRPSSRGSHARGRGQRPSTSTGKVSGAGGARARMQPSDDGGGGGGGGQLGSHSHGHLHLHLHRPRSAPGGGSYDHSDDDDNDGHAAAAAGDGGPWVGEQLSVATDTSSLLASSGISSSGISGYRGTLGQISPDVGSDRDRWRRCGEALHRAGLAEQQTTLSAGSVPMHSNIGNLSGTGRAPQLLRHKPGARERIAGSRARYGAVEGARTVRASVIHHCSALLK